MSTGLFITYPSQASIAFLDDVTHWLTVNQGQQWDQAAFNEARPSSVRQLWWGHDPCPAAAVMQVLTAHLISVQGGSLRYRLLPLDLFANLCTRPSASEVLALLGSDDVQLLMRSAHLCTNCSCL